MAKPEPPPEPPKTFQVSGKVIDKSSGEAVAHATVKVSGFAAEGVSIDDKSGTFQFGPIPIDGGLVQVRVEATGYNPAEQTFAKGPPNAIKELTFELIPLAKNIPAVLKGIIIDARSGKPIRGLVAIPAIKKKIRADEDGSFKLELKAGRYDVAITSPRHVSQLKTVELRPGDVVILNLDMTPRGR